MDGAVEDKNKKPPYIVRKEELRGKVKTAEAQAKKFTEAIPLRQRIHIS